MIAILAANKSCWKKHYSPQASNLANLVKLTQEKINNSNFFVKQW
jgi:hypothetical protein